MALIERKDEREISVDKRFQKGRTSRRTEPLIAVRGLGVRLYKKSMPTVLRIGPYRFHFYSDEGNEPPHIHVRFEGNDVKYWLAPIGLARNRGVPAHRLNEIERLVFENKILLIEKYNEHRNKQR